MTHERPVLVACFIAVTLSAAPPAPLAGAAKKMDRPTAQSLLKQKADPNTAQPDGTTARHWAAHQDDLETARLLLKGGANANAANRYGVTPLSEACTNGNGLMAPCSTPEPK